MQVSWNIFNLNPNNNPKANPNIIQSARMENSYGRSYRKICDIRFSADQVF